MSAAAAEPREKKAERPKIKVSVEHIAGGSGRVTAPGATGSASAEQAEAL